MLLLTVCGVLVALVSSVAGDCTGSWKSYGGSCYFVSHDIETWTGAMDMCKRLGGNLVEISDSGEDMFLASLIHSGTNTHTAGFWIGLTDVELEGTWMWMTSMTSLTDVGYSNWEPGQPDNGKGVQNCAWLNGNNAGKWRDGPCGFGSKNYLCEKEDGSGGEIVG